jgi:hypothetical protein
MATAEAAIQRSSDLCRRSPTRSRPCFRVVYRGRGPASPTETTLVRYRQVLEEAGYRVTVASDGPALLVIPLPPDPRPASGTIRSDPETAGGAFGLPSGWAVP